MIAELYRSMDDWLVDQNSDIRASEVQGLLAGLMAANIQVRPEEYVARLAEYADLHPGVIIQITEMTNLINYTKKLNLCMIL